jgi:hypothetical protein
VERVVPESFRKINLFDAIYPCGISASRRIFEYLTSNRRLLEYRLRKRGIEKLDLLAGHCVLLELYLHHQNKIWEVDQRVGLSDPIAMFIDEFDPRPRKEITHELVLGFETLEVLDDSALIGAALGSGASGIGGDCPQRRIAELRFN